MILKNTTITKGFLLAGLMNASVLIFTRLFTNFTISEFDPNVMSNFGLLSILLWGLAYIAVAKNFHRVPWLVGLFVIEKLIYGLVWINWMLHNSLTEVYEKDLLAGVFYTVYGINDWVFFIFFLMVFVRLSKSPIKE